MALADKAIILIISNEACTSGLALLKEPGVGLLSCSNYSHKVHTERWYINAPSFFLYVPCVN